MFWPVVRVLWLAIIYRELTTICVDKTSWRRNFFGVFTKIDPLKIGYVIGLCSVWIAQKNWFVKLNPLEKCLGWNWAFIQQTLRKIPWFQLISCRENLQKGTVFTLGYLVKLRYFTQWQLALRRYSKSSICSGKAYSTCFSLAGTFVSRR